MNFLRVAALSSSIATQFSHEVLGDIPIWGPQRVVGSRLPLFPDVRWHRKGFGLYTIWPPEVRSTP
jgi:hypothetical protein